MTTLNYAKNDIAADQATYAFPTSFAQEGLWFLHQLEPESAAYNLQVAIHKEGRVDVELIQRSLNVIVQRHEVLRTCFRMINEQPMQVIASSLFLPLPVVDLRKNTEDERKTLVLQLAREELRQPFDLIQGPLIRAKLLWLDEDEYLLLLSMHHLISDGWSMDVLFRELVTSYEAFSSGQTSPVPELPIQYGDFAVWQREMLQGNILAEHLAYWKKQLSGRPSGLELPADRLRLQDTTSQGSTYHVTLPKELTEALKELSRHERVTLYMTLVASFQTLLYRYTGQDDLVIGTIAAGRTQGDTEALIGFFANTLVLRTDLSGNPTFRELLRRVREVILDAQAHQDLPFEYMVKELRPERYAGRNPLFQVLISLELPLSTLSSGWTMNQMEIETGASRFDLALDIKDGSEGLVCSFEYSTDLFDETTIVRMAGHLQRLLEAVVADPGRQLPEFPLLTEPERHQILVEWNTTAVDYPRNLCIHQLFENQAERVPEAVAVVFEDEHLTYRELNRRANQLAHYLQHLGVGPDVLVGIYVERSLDMIVGLLGILKAGGAYLPLDPAFPTERIEFMLEDAQIPVLITQQHLTAQLPNHTARVVCLDTEGKTLSLQSETNSLPTAHSDNLAYVIYTSGSTGRPKGVQIIHRAVVNFLLSMREQPGLRAEDTLLAVTTLSFDIAALELFLPLVVGAQVVIASQEIVADGIASMEILTRKHITVMQATPVTWRILLAAGWQGNHSLKIICGGEALPPDLAQQLLPRAASLWNIYGPTETTIWSSTCKIEPGEKTITIGRPIANTQMYLLDAHLQSVPIGVPGELYIGGDGLARGYLKRPELTSARFIPHPFSDNKGDRLYKTGDLARYRSDGTIEHLGRLDFQVKIRGYRIELGEIEAVLNQHPAVHQTVVVAREDVPGDKRLVAYLVMKKGLDTSVEDLKHHVTKQVPAYMVPSIFVILEEMPLTPNGKIDRGAFPVPELSRYSSNDSFVVPTLPLHSQLVQIWEDLLDVRPIGTRDNFFDLGGHSLLAARLVNRIEQDWGKKIPLNTLLADATIERLAEVIMQPEEESLVNPVGENSLEGNTGFSKTKKGLFKRVAGVVNCRSVRVSEWRL